jgi:hypothetical protein
MEKKDILPRNNKHQPIIYAKYADIDKKAGAGDAKFLSLGKATWNSEDCSAKVWRYSDEAQKWQRGSEELPLWRVLDLAKLVIATICGKDSGMDEEPVNKQEIQILKDYINDNMSLYIPRIQKLKEILENSGPSIVDKQEAPNIFSFATSELSQDAMFAYLIKWANPKNISIDKEMCLLGQSFLRLLAQNNDLTINSVEVGRQWQNIDVWVEINDDTILIIEDKTNTSIHDDQLERYREIIQNEYKGKRQIQFYTYVKTGNEPAAILDTIRKKGYTTINRSQILSVLNDYKGNNPLVQNYREHLQNLEDLTNVYRYTTVDKWDGNAWQGFYMGLEEYFNDFRWAYVPNRAGGFWGAFWHFMTPENIDNLEMYLQFEESKLCFKIYYGGQDNKSAIREKCFNALLECSNQITPEIDRPDKFGAGTYMTIGIVKADKLFGNGIVNIHQIVNKLKKYEEIVDMTIKLLS